VWYLTEPPYFSDCRSGISGDCKKRRTLRIDRSQRTIEALVGSLAIASERVRAFDTGLLWGERLLRQRAHARLAA